jgi:hypothetical protein
MTITDDLFRFYPDMPKFKAPALCTQTDPALFTDLPPGVNFRDARKTCSRCEAQPECLQYALTRGLDHDAIGANPHPEKASAKGDHPRHPRRCPCPPASRRKGLRSVLGRLPGRTPKEG